MARDSRFRIDFSKKTPLPIGRDIYSAVASGRFYCVDKTLMIKDILDENVQVMLFTRPRRFGKTLNMDMLKTFFEKSERDNSIYFKDKKIWSLDEKYRKHQGKYPVIYLTFKDCKETTWEETLENFSNLIRCEFDRHGELLESSKCSKMEREEFNRILENRANSDNYSTSLKLLSKMLYEYWGIEPIVIIDEYDVPIQQGYVEGFYKEVVAFMRNFFSGIFKNNRYLSRGFLTGILRVSQESIFSGLNNLAVYTVLNEEYSEYFGFTHDEVMEMAKYYEVEEKFAELCEWYDGYNFGGTEIFNPWSVINYFGGDCEPIPYWVSTSSNDIIGEILENVKSSGNDKIYNDLTKLMNGKSVEVEVFEGFVYSELENNPEAIYTLLLFTGYVKAIESKFSYEDGCFICKLTLPNKELTTVYKYEIRHKLDFLIQPNTGRALREALKAGDAAKIRDLLQTLLSESASYYDTAGESFYHGLMLGLCAWLGAYYVTSNRESGEGRYDIQLMPRKNDSSGILIELKACGDSSENALKAASEKALRQIDEKRYDVEMVKNGVNPILKYGLAFCGKKAEVAMAIQEKHNL